MLNFLGHGELRSMKNIGNMKDHPIITTMVAISLLKVLPIGRSDSTIILQVNWASLIEEIMEGRFMPEPERTSENALTWEQVVNMSMNELIMMFDQPLVSSFLAENNGIDDHTSRVNIYMMKLFFSAMVVKVNIATMYRGEYSRVESGYLT